MRRNFVVEKSGNLSYTLGGSTLFSTHGMRAKDTRLLREKHASEDPLGKVITHPKGAKTVPEESECSGAYPFAPY